jgi:hypothetical protein
MAELTSNSSALKPKVIKYSADSSHLWNYGHLLDSMKFDKIQVLTHPDEWSSRGLNEEENSRLSALYAAYLSLGSS